MQILRDLNLSTKLKNSNLLIDTNILIAAINFPDYLKLLFDIKNAGCEFCTVPAVYFEFIRGSDCIDVLNKRINFVKQLQISVYPIEKHFFEKNLDDWKEGIVVLQKILKGADYADFQLGLFLYKFRNSSSENYVLTENCNHFPLSIFSRKFLITFDTDKEIRNHAIYEMSNDKLNKAAEDILGISLLDPTDIPF